MKSLTGEFVGWQVATVNPRAVVLESRDGQSLELDLADSRYENTGTAQARGPGNPLPRHAAAGSADEAGAGEDEPLSRAEQIRQRIAERREELRLEQEMQQSSEGGTQAATASQPARPADYQSAIRALMQNKSKDQDSNDEKDG